MRGVRITHRKEWLCSTNGDLSQWIGKNGVGMCKHSSMNLDPVECMAHGNLKCKFKQEKTDEDRKKGYENHLLRLQRRKG